MSGSDVMNRRRATCRHCGESLVEEGADPVMAAWRAEESGTLACIPSHYGRDAVPHTPMPDGFRGAPQ